jgi:hypothetical protein
MESQISGLFQDSLLEISEKVPQAQERRASKVLECGFFDLRETIPVRDNRVI